MTASRPAPVIAIHGGAGILKRTVLSDAQVAQYTAALREILEAGQAMLAAGASALDAVTHAVGMLEDCPLFNAGRGAVFTSDGTHELDASIMDGATLRAGSVACVTRIKSPIRAARAVMERSEHVLMVGPGAETFAFSQGLERVAPDYFSTENRRQQLVRAREAETMMLDHDGASIAFRHAPLDEDRKFGTVGAVALDAGGHLAAATSTGGMTNKRPGRVGDSPLIGAGTYADDRTAAISCTGAGEFYIRVAAAHDVCARMAYGGQSLEQASNAVIHDVLAPMPGRGGLIAVDAAGHVCLPFNSEGMYRGFARVGEAPVAAIFRDAP